MIREELHHWARSSIKRTPFLQHLYASTELVLGELALKRQQFFRAADHFCKASRRVGIDARTRQRAQAEFKQFFQPNGIRGTLGDFLQTPFAASLRARFLARPFPENIIFGGNLIPLKAYDPRTGERGVLLLAYNYIFQAFHALFRTEELRKFYRIVLEPSYTYVEDPGYTLFRGWDVVVEDRIPFVRSGLQWLGNIFETVNLNAGDWVDPDTFYPLPNQGKIYDLIYVASYARYKRHEVLFRTLAKIRRPMRVAIVGFPFERRREDIEAEMRRYGVTDGCEIFERISFEELNRLLGSSRINLMISSHLESANRALYEAMYANVPSIVNRDCEGIDLSYVNEHTGVQASDGTLAEAILDMLDRPNQFAPRAWALEHTNYLRSTQIINAKLKELSQAEGEPWRTDIAAKVNRPDPVYKNKEDAERLQPVLHHLAQFLRP
jgi:glycosyltransferase involved in cell wall biosynthesis